MEFELPDGNTLTLPDGATGNDAAAAIGPGLARAALAIKVNGEVRDLARALPTGDGATPALPTGDGATPGRIEILTERSGDEALSLIRHDCAHVLATAVTELYPGVKISIGPPIENGFYYDFDFPDGVTVSESDFGRIEERMREHIAADEPFVREEVQVTEALERFRREGQDYKLQLVQDIVREQGVQSVSLYTNGPFTDLCRGPHAPSTGRIKAFKLQSVAGAYWRGDATKPMLTRVYGTAFFSVRALQEHLDWLEQARSRDHRKLGRELNLFMFSEFSPGSPFWQPAGAVIWNALAALWREQNLARGYQEVRTPILYDVELWKQSGHWEKYREHMYFTDVENREMGLKPMNCPAHIQIYNATRRSHRDLPMRLAEQGLVHRHEPSGTLHGLLRVRSFTQDDAHIFCSEDQIEGEVIACLDFAFYLYELFGFDPRLELSTRPPQRIGTDEMWDQAEDALRHALERRGLEHEVNEGDGAFYGPKIDLHMSDSIGRSWQLGTIQLDYAMPGRFGMTYVGADNVEHQPVMIHRALFGSFERLIGVLIEHYAGVFPLWLAPVQAIVLTIADRHDGYGRAVVKRLRGSGARVELDERSESVGRKIRDAEMRKIPYMLIVGDREQEADSVALREHGGGDAGAVAVGEVIERIRREVETRSRA